MRRACRGSRHGQQHQFHESFRWRSRSSADGLRSSTFARLPHYAQDPPGTCWQPALGQEKHQSHVRFGLLGQHAVEQQSSGRKIAFVSPVKDAKSPAPSIPGFSRATRISVNTDSGSQYLDYAVWYLPSFRLHCVRAVSTRLPALLSSRPVPSRTSRNVSCRTRFP